MKTCKFLLTGIFTLTLFSIGFGQNTFVITDPTNSTKDAALPEASENLIRKEVLPKAKSVWDEEICSSGSEEFNGVANGAFTKSGANQTLVLMQYCQTGNGLGNSILVLMENGKIVKSYGAESGWTISLKKLPDINQNGVDEFAVTYGGGMHQGQGGTGIDIFEFSGGKIKPLGWFGESAFTETSEYSYKVWVKKGKTPIFYREKYVPGKNDRQIKVGKPKVFTLLNVDNRSYTAWN